MRKQPKIAYWLALVLVGAAGGYAALSPSAKPGEVVASAQVKVLTGGIQMEMAVQATGEDAREATVNAVRELARQLDALLPPPRPSTGKVGMGVVP